jgi:hypothetical protein
MLSRSSFRPAHRGGRPDVDVIALAVPAEDRLLLGLGGREARPTLVAEPLIVPLPMFVRLDASRCGVADASRIESKSLLGALVLAAHPPPPRSVTARRPAVDPSVRPAGALPVCSPPGAGVSPTSPGVRPGPCGDRPGRDRPGPCRAGRPRARVGHPGNAPPGLTAGAGEGGGKLALERLGSVSSGLVRIEMVSA